MGEKGEAEMGELSITLAIILCAWVYAALHPVNMDVRDKVGGSIGHRGAYPRGHHHRHPGGSVT